MRTFQLGISGDLSDCNGKPSSDIALDLLHSETQMHWEFLKDQQPSANDPTYKDRMYSLQITPEHVAQYDGIAVCRPWVKSTAFERGTERLLAIGRAGIGYDKIDLAACTAADVVVFNSPFGLTHSTASAAMLLILALSKRLPVQERLVREYRWDAQSQATGDDLTGKILGIVGLGQTAIELIRLLAPFQMRVIAYSRHANIGQAQKLGVQLVGSMEELFSQADYVSLHNRLTPETAGSIGERHFRLMKPTAYFVNIARGELVDEHALLRCLQERRIAGAGLDVFETEPLPLSSPFLKLDNVILTPHWLCSTHQAGRATMAAILEGMLRIAGGQIPANILNPAVLERPGFQAKLRSRA